MKKEPYLYTTAFIMVCSMSCMGLCIPLLAVWLGATYQDLGIIGAVSSLTYSLACLASGRLSDRLGYQRYFSFSGIAVALSITLYIWTTRVSHVAVLFGITRLLLSGCMAPLQAWLGVHKSRVELLRTLGFFNVSWSFGLLIGPAIGGALYAVDLKWPFLFSAGLIGIVSISMFHLKFHEIAPTSTDSAPPDNPVNDSFLRIARVATFATFFALGTIRSLFPKFATDLGVPPGSLGLLMATIGLAMLITFYLVSRSERWQFRLAPLAAAQLLGGVGLTWLALGSGSIDFAIGLLATGVLAGFSFTGSIFYSLFTGGPKGRRTGFHEAVIGSAFFIGPLVGGVAAEYLGLRSPYLIAAGVILFALGVQAWLYLHKRQGSDVQTHQSLSAS